MAEPSPFRHCSTCKRPIAFGAPYYRCSVSTCNRPRIGLFFCSVECWDAHLPMMRHREAWAEPVQAPAREEWEAEQASLLERETTKKEHAMSDESDKQPPGATAEPPHEVLVVVSKLKAYIRAKSGMNTSDSVVSVVSDELRKLCDQAIANATRDGRKTVMDRDFHAPAPSE